MIESIEKKDSTSYYASKDNNNLLGISKAIDFPKISPYLVK